MNFEFRWKLQPGIPLKQHKGDLHCNPSDKDSANDPKECFEPRQTQLNISQFTAETLAPNILGFGVLDLYLSAMAPKMFWSAACIYTVIVVATGQTCREVNDDPICSKVGNAVCTGNMTKFGTTRCPNMCNTCDAAVLIANATAHYVIDTTGVFDGRNCSNSVPDCNELGNVVCEPPLQDFGLKYCGVKCERCFDKQNDTVNEMSTTTTSEPRTSPLQTTKNPEICDEYIDDPICRAIGVNICNVTYNEFSTRRCRFFCELCSKHNTTTMNHTMTPTNQTQVPDGRVCYDDDRECADIGAIICQSPLDMYGRVHCQLFCGFCKDNSTAVITTPVTPTTEKTTTKSSELNKTVEYCAEKTDDAICRVLGQVICTNYTAFAKVKCPFMCEYCDPSVNYTGEVPSTTPRTPITSEVGQTCYDDDPECSDIGPSVCEAPLDVFGGEHCRRFCKLCTVVTQPTAASTLQQTTTLRSTPASTSGIQQTTTAYQPSTGGVCVNDPDANCEKLGRQICEGPLLDFGRLKCPQYCELCWNSSVPRSTERTTVVVPTPLPTGEPEPNFFNDCNTTAELVFVLDSSSSVGEANFQLMREFTQNVTLRLKQEYNIINVTVITYSNKARVALKLSESTDIATMLALEANITYDHGGTNTHTALDLMMQQFSRDVNNPKVGIVITDGTSFEPDKTAQSAHNAKMNGIVMFVIGIGDDINPHELTSISSKPDSNYLFQVTDFSALRAIAEQFQAKSCTTPAPPTTSTTTSVATTTTTEPAPVTTTEAATQTISAVTDAQNTPSVKPPVTLPTVPSENTVKSSIATAVQTPVTRPTMPTETAFTDKPIVLTGVVTDKPPVVTTIPTVMTPVQPVQTDPTVSKIPSEVSVNPVVTGKVTSTEKTETQRPPAVTQIITESTPSVVTNPPSPAIITTEGVPPTTVTLAPPVKTTTTAEPPQTPAFTTTSDVTMVVTTTDAQPPTQSPVTQKQMTTTSAEPPKTPERVTTTERITFIQTDATSVLTSTTQAATPQKLTTTTAEPPTRLQETSTQQPFTTTVVNSQTQKPLTTTMAPQQTEPQTAETTTSTTTKATVPTSKPVTTTKTPIETPEPETTTQAPIPTTEKTTTTAAPTQEQTKTPIQTPELVTTPKTPVQTPESATTMQPSVTTTEAPIQTPEPTTTTKAPMQTYEQTTTTITPIQTPEPTTKAPLQTSEPTTTTIAPIQTPEPTTKATMKTPEQTTTTIAPIQTPERTTKEPMQTSEQTTTTKAPIQTPEPITKAPMQTSEQTTTTIAPIQTPEPTTKATIKTPEQTTKTIAPIQTPEPTTKTPMQTYEQTTTTIAPIQTPEQITTPKTPIQSTEPIITTSTTEKPLTTSQLTQQPAESTTTLPKSTTTASCVAKVADVVFVVDASGSIGIENFDKVKAFIKDIVRTFDVDPRYTQVALVEFSTYARIEFKLNEHSNLTDLIAAIDNIHYSGGGTMTSDALELMRGPGYEGERPGAPDISIVITDGLSKYPPITKIQADRAKAEGITMFSIGIGNQTDQAELTELASGPQFQFFVGEFGALSKIDNVVAHLACGVILPTNPYTRTTTPMTTTLAGCVDTADCSGYSKDSCSDYEPYARGHCAKTCGFCGTEVERPCKDAIPNCGSYGTYICFDINQYQWVDKNCRKFCGFCGNKTEVLIESSTTTTTVTTTPAGCDDVLQCREYNADLCTNPEYRGFAEKNCRKYCGYCLADIYTVTPHTTGIHTCPAWVLPKECRLVHENNNCCPVPICSDGFKLLVKRA
ncbi:hypothetical protein DPMN_103552 [Dreissena polymorpha]|uniref:Uncharacterized protein n=1 Tax=Dreissena polymorpha TaxID=45954 RepID=A0A9D4HEH7_DREPO|nr:hypothetical protein DPMN_103552 [Dreissena polymorpha]